MWIFSEFKRYWILLVIALIILISFDVFAPNGIPISVFAFVFLFWSIYYLWKYFSNKKKKNNMDDNSDL